MSAADAVPVSAAVCLIGCLTCTRDIRRPKSLVRVRSRQDLSLVLSYDLTDVTLAVDKHHNGGKSGPESLIKGMDAQK